MNNFKWFLYGGLLGSLFENLYRLSKGHWSKYLVLVTIGWMAAIAVTRIVQNKITTKA